MTANWTAPGNNKWTILMGIGIQKTFKLGGQLQQLEVAYYTNVVRPTGGAYGQWRLLWSLLYPVKRNAPDRLTHHLALDGKPAANPGQNSPKPYRFDAQAQNKSTVRNQETNIAPSPNKKPDLFVQA
jgi:hypothetical protein